MSKEAVIQIRMESELKNSVEELYRSMGTTFVEAVRIFAMQSVKQQAMPFIITNKDNDLAGSLQKYANINLISKEKDIFEKELIKRYAKTN